MTARLSKAFYDSVGEKAANELVDWFNAVDAAYRADLRELNEINFARFDAKLEQRFSAQDSKIDQFRTEILAAMRAGFAEFDTELERRLGEQIRFMYLAWATMLAAIVAFGVR
ncbi:MAG: hypothetical protein AABZ80_06175 [Gemmatimonadota bacterium]